MDQAVICFPLGAPTPLSADDELLLIRKKRGLGAGLYNGPGGKVEGEETPRDAAVRETEEEVRLRVSELDQRASLEFYFGDDPLFDCTVFTTTSVSGTPRETPEADPKWVQRSDIPYDEMWEDDSYWLPQVLDGKTVTGVFEFDDDGEELLDWDLETEL